MESLNIQETRNKIFYLFMGIVIVALIYFLAPILTPFLAGALLAYFADPLVEKMTSWRIPRVLNVVIVFFGILFVLVLALLLLIPLIEKQINAFILFLPTIIAWLQNTILPWLSDHLGIETSIDTDTLKTTLASSWTKASGAAGWMLQTVLHSSKAIAMWLSNLILIPVVTFYLLRDWNVIIHNVRELLPRHIEPVVVKLVRDCDNTLSAFIRGQLLVMLALSCIYSIGLTILGVQLGMVIGLAAGMLSIVPYLGFISGIIIASIVTFIQFGTLKMLCGVWIVFAIGQSAEGMILTPMLVGNRIGLHPVAVIFSVLTGGMLCGFFGVLLALPVAAIIMVLLRHLNDRYRDSSFYR